MRPPATCLRGPCPPRRQFPGMTALPQSHWQESALLLCLRPRRSTSSRDTILGVGLLAWDPRSSRTEDETARDPDWLSGSLLIPDLRRGKQRQPVRQSNPSVKSQTGGPPPPWQVDNLKSVAAQQLSCPDGLSEIELQAGHEFRPDLKQRHNGTTSQARGRSKGRPVEVQKLPILTPQRPLGDFVERSHEPLSGTVEEFDLWSVFSPPIRNTALSKPGRFPAGVGVFLPTQTNTHVPEC